MGGIDTSGLFILPLMRSQTQFTMLGETPSLPPKCRHWSAYAFVKKDTRSLIAGSMRPMFLRSRWTKWVLYLIKWVKHINISRFLSLSGTSSSPSSIYSSVNDVGWSSKILLWLMLRFCRNLLSLMTSSSWAKTEGLRLCQLTFRSRSREAV